MHFSILPAINFFRRHVFTFGIGLAVVVLVVGGLVFVLPRWQKVQEFGGLNYTRKQDTLAAQKQYLTELQRLKEDLETVSLEDLNRLDAVIPKGKDIPGIFKQMNVFAREVGMELLSVSVNEGTAVSSASTATAGQPSKLYALTISVTLGGQLDYARLKSFLDSVSRQAPLLDLTSIANSSSTSSLATTHSFIFRSYYLVP
jgi:hypothetical protein